MLMSKFGRGKMQEELFMNFKESIYMMIDVSWNYGWNYGMHTLEIFLVVEPMKLIQSQHR